MYLCNVMQCNPVKQYAPMQQGSVRSGNSVHCAVCILHNVVCTYEVCTYMHLYALICTYEVCTYMQQGWVRSVNTMHCTLCTIRCAYSERTMHYALCSRVHLCGDGGSVRSGNTGIPGHKPAVAPPLHFSSDIFNFSSI